MKNLGQLMKQAQQMQSRMQEIQARLESAEMTGSAGGGLVSITLSGKGEMRKVRIDPTLLQPGEAEVLEGSLYWVIKGVIQARQRILDLQEVNLGDGIPRCALVLDAEVIRTEAAPRRPFQGWRYLDPDEAPLDLNGRSKADITSMPPKLRKQLAELGLI